MSNQWIQDAIFSGITQVGKHITLPPHVSDSLRGRLFELGDEELVDAGVLVRQIADHLATKNGELAANDLGLIVAACVEELVRRELAAEKRRAGAQKKWGTSAGGGRSSSGGRAFGAMRPPNAPRVPAVRVQRGLDGDGPAMHLSGSTPAPHAALRARIAETGATPPLAGPARAAEVRRVASQLLLGRLTIEDASRALRISMDAAVRWRDQITAAVEGITPTITKPPTARVAPSAPPTKRVGRCPDGTLQDTH